MVVRLNGIKKHKFEYVKNVDRSLRVHKGHNEQFLEISLQYH